MDSTAMTVTTSSPDEASFMARLAVRRAGRAPAGPARLVLTSRGMDLHSSIAGRLFG